MFVAAEDYADHGLDLNKRLIERPAATFFMRAAGSSPDSGVKDGDLLVVDRAEKSAPGKVVVAVVNGELTVRRLPASWRGEGVEVWGVVRWLVREA